MTAAKDYEKFFSNLPLQRTAYSDRTCLLMAHMAQNVYLDEGEELDKALDELGFKLIKFFNSAEKDPKTDTQAFLVEGDDFYILSFRGTASWKDALTDLCAMPFKMGSATFHKGFYSAYCIIKDEVETEVSNLQKPIYVTGHSLGAALAIISCAVSLPQNNVAACYTFGSPNAGDASFNQEVLKFPIYRVVNWLDIVSRVPFWWPSTGYLTLLSYSGQRLRGQTASRWMIMIYLVLLYAAPIGGLITIISMLFVSRGFGPLSDHFMKNYIEKLTLIAEDRHDLKKEKREKRIMGFVSLFIFVLCLSPLALLWIYRHLLF